MPDARDGSPTDAHRFAPAAPAEEHVYGACCPGWHSTTDHDAALDEWIEFMQRRDIDRVCSLLSGDVRETTHAARLREAFGPDNVRHVPIADHHLADAEALETELFPFVDDAVANDERVLIHCLDGISRTGHVLAAWLVHGRDYDPVDAIETVEQMGRTPAEAVEAGNARRGELYELLAHFE